MWAAAISGTRNASQHHIQEGAHLSKVTLKFVYPFVESGFVLSSAGLLEHNGLIGSVASCTISLIATLPSDSMCLYVCVFSSSLRLASPRTFRLLYTSFVPDALRRLKSGWQRTVPNLTGRYYLDYV